MLQGIIRLTLGGLLAFTLGCGGGETGTDKAETPTPHPELNKSTETPDGMGDPGPGAEPQTDSEKSGEANPAEQPPLSAPTPTNN